MTPGSTPSTTSPDPRRSTASLSSLWIIVALDGLFTLPFVFNGPGEMDTLRYVLGFHGWMQGHQPLGSLFNAEMSFGYYIGLYIWQQVFQPALAALPNLLNGISAASGVVCVGALYLWWRHWWDDRVAVRLALLLISTPAFWSLHLYGNTNITGFALAALALALLPGRDGGRQPARWIAVWGLGTLALTVRTDVLMLGPAVIAFLIWGRERPGWKVTAMVGAASFLTYLLLRWIALGPPTGGGSILRHWSSNTNFVDAKWVVHTTALNLASLFTETPPLTLLASLLCFFVAGTRSGHPVRRTTLWWISPMLLFLFFSRVHLSRILIPLFPGALLPLAFWASRSTARDLTALAIIVASHVSMLAMPAIEDRIRGGSRERRVSHYISHQGMFRDHAAIQEDARELMADAEELLRTQANGVRDVVVIGDDILAYELVLLSANPRARVQKVFQAERVSLRVADVPGWEHRWYFLHPRWDRDPEAALARGEVPPDAIRHSTPWVRRTRARASP